MDISNKSTTHHNKSPFFKKKHQGSEFKETYGRDVFVDASLLPDIAVKSKAPFFAWFIGWSTLGVDWIGVKIPTKVRFQHTKGCVGWRCVLKNNDLRWHWCLYVHQMDRCWIHHWYAKVLHFPVWTFTVVPTHRPHNWMIDSQCIESSDFQKTCLNQIFHMHIYTQSITLHYV